MDVAVQRPGNSLSAHKLHSRDHLAPPAPPSTSSSTLVDDSPPSREFNFDPSRDKSFPHQDWGKRMTTTGKQTFLSDKSSFLSLGKSQYDSKIIHDNNSDYDKNYSDGGQTPHPSRHPHLSYRPDATPYTEVSSYRPSVTSYGNNRTQSTTRNDDKYSSDWTRTTVSKIFDPMSNFQNISHADTSLTAPDIDVSTFSFGIPKNHGPGTSWLHDGKSIMSVTETHPEHKSIGTLPVESTLSSTTTSPSEKSPRRPMSPRNRFSQRNLSERREEIEDNTNEHEHRTWLATQSRLIDEARTTDDIMRIEGEIEGYLTPTSAKAFKRRAQYSTIESPSRKMELKSNHDFQDGEELNGSNISDAFQFQEHSTPQLRRTLVTTSTPKWKSIPGYLHGINTPAPSKTRESDDNEEDSEISKQRNPYSASLSPSTTKVSTQHRQRREDEIDEENSSPSIPSRSYYHLSSNRVGPSKFRESGDDGTDDKIETPEKQPRTSLLSFVKTPRFPGHFSMQKSRETHPCADAALDKRDMLPAPSQPTITTSISAKTLSSTPSSSRILPRMTPPRSLPRKGDASVNEDSSTMLWKRKSPRLLRSVRFMKNQESEEKTGSNGELAINDESQSVYYPGAYKSIILENDVKNEEDEEEDVYEEDDKEEKENEDEGGKQPNISISSVDRSRNDADIKDLPISEGRQVTESFTINKVEQGSPRIKMTPDEISRNTKRKEIYEKLAQANVVESTLAIKIEDLKQSVEDIGTKIGEKLSQVLERNFQTESRRRRAWLICVLILEIVFIAAMILISEVRNRQLFYSGYFEPFYGGGVLPVQNHIGRETIEAFTSSGFYYSSDNYGNENGGLIGSVGSWIGTILSRVLSMLRVVTGDIIRVPIMLVDSSDEIWIPS